MVTDKTEEEQVEALKKWFEENGVSLVVGIVLALAAVFGYRAWDNNVRETGEAASAIYENLVSAVVAVPGEGLSESMRTTGQTLADQLKNEYGDSTYAQFAGLQMARVAVEAGDLDKAATELKWVISNGAQGSIEIIARMRLARVLESMDKLDEAMATIDVKRDLGQHRSSWEEVRGDIYLAMGKNEEARQAYQLALTNVSQEGAKPYLTMKLEDLTYAEAAIEGDGESDSASDASVDEASDGTTDQVAEEIE